MTSLKLKLLTLSVVALFLAAPNPVYAQDCNCGDLNGDSSTDIYDIQPLVDHLIGIPLPGDTICASLDGARDITLNDLMEMYWFLFISFPALYCDTSRTLSYPISTVDTIYLPGAVDLPENVTRYELPLFAKHGLQSNGFGPRFKGAYLPLRGLGAGSDNRFSLTSIKGEGFFPANSIEIAGDTSVMIYTTLYTFEPIEQVASLEYTRTGTGTSHIVPEIVASVLGRRMVIKVNRPPYVPQVPQVKTYSPSPCCSAGAGNVDCDPNDVVDITDLTVLIDHLFINFTALCCKSEANIDLDTDVVVDVSDLTKLIDHLFISFPPLASCQRPFLDD